MQFRQFTKCVDASHFLGFKWVQYVLAGGAAVAGAALTALLGGAFIPGLMVGFLSLVIAYCLWWLYDRLICLGGDICILGFVLTVEPPEEKTGLDSFDTDYSINLVLAPDGIGATRAEVESSLPQGKFMGEQPGVANYSFLGYHLPFEGNLIQKFPTGKPDGSQFLTDCMHIEFEGGGVYDLLQACYAALALAAVAAAVCAVPIFGWIACLVLSIASGLITLVGAINALNDKGNPTDVNSNLTSIHAANAPDGSGADILVVSGTWVYDSAHQGYNEVHPVKQCVRTGSIIVPWTLIDVGTPDHPVPLAIDDIGAYIDSWCSALSAAVSVGTIANQGQPQNQWVLHPLVDGCQPDEPPPR